MLGDTKYENNNNNANARSNREFFLRLSNAQNSANETVLGDNSGELQRSNFDIANNNLMINNSVETQGGRKSC